MVKDKSGEGGQTAVGLDPINEGVQPDVVRVNERIMYVKVVIRKQIIHIVSAYAPQVGLSAEEKDDFCDSFIIVLSGIPK